MKIDEVLVKPIMTEKATGLAHNQVYMFEVEKNVNKFQIKSVLEKLYKVKVGKMRIMIRKGKGRHVGRRMKTKKLPDKKLAFVTIKEGKIELFPQA